MDAYPPVMRVARIGAGILVSLVGIVWTLQGLGSEYVPQSFMTNSVWWVVIGLATLIAGVTLVVRASRQSR